MIAVEQLTHSPPDGYTLMINRPREFYRRASERAIPVSTANTTAGSGYSKIAATPERNADRRARVVSSRTFGSICRPSNAIPGYVLSLLTPRGSGVIAHTVISGALGRKALLWSMAASCCAMPRQRRYASSASSSLPWSRSMSADRQDCSRLGGTFDGPTHRTGRSGARGKLTA
jgi:hypothetical protein